MHDFLAALRRSSGVATLIAFTTVVICGAERYGRDFASDRRVEKAASRAQARITELAASQSRLSASMDAADRSIKSLSSDLDQPRPLASILDARR